MKLICTLRSPYARKCRVVALERNIGDQLELVTVDLMNKPAFLYESNPLGKVPTLVRDNGLLLCDSKLICQYLDTIGEVTSLYPNGEKGIQTLHNAMMGEGIIDSLIIVLREYRRKEMKMQAVIDKNNDDIYRTLDYLQETMPEWSGEITIASLTIGVALCYLDYGHFYDAIFPEWKSRNEPLAAWLAGFRERPSFKSTEPV